MVARELPSDEVLASWQHVEQRALDLRAAGIPGTLQDLRVRAYLDLLQERDTRDVPARRAPDRPTRPASRTRPATGRSRPPDPPADGPASAGQRPVCPGRSRRLRRLRRPRRLRRLRADRLPVLVLAEVTPGRAWPRWSPSLSPWPPFSAVPKPRRGRRVRPAGRRRRPRPGRRRARHRSTRWCVTALNADGTAAAHGCLPGRRFPPVPGPRARCPPCYIALIPVTRGTLRPRPCRGRLPPQPQAGPPDLRPHCPMHRAGLRPARRPLRPGPHHRLGSGRSHLRVRSRSAMSSSPSV